jgi:hypothetical protein
MVKARPDLFYASAGTGQAVNQGSAAATSRVTSCELDEPQ